MDDIVDQVASQAGIDRSVARQAVGIILNFLSREGPRPQVGVLVDGIPGGKALADQYAGSGTGLMGVYGDLSAAGLGMGEIQSVTRTFVGLARERVGTDKVDAVVNAIPGLGQFV
jgi:hypothetical protein